MPLTLKEQVTLLPSIAATRAELGQQAADDIAAELRRLLAVQSGVRMIFAAAPSQSEMLDALILAPGIDWSRITAFHMDEYLDLPADAPQRFGTYLRHKIFSRVPFADVHLIEPGNDPQAAADEYAARLAAAAIDIVCCGIGSNGHLAFNDPPARFDDPNDVNIVRLDEVCRQQQVDDLCFEQLDDVPTHALSLSIPRLMAASSIFCCVPGSFKDEAVQATLEGPITIDCPASVLRLHPACNLYLDQDSAARLTR